MSFDRQFDVRLSRLAQSMKGVAGLVTNQINRSIVTVARGTARRAAQLTPRSSGPGPHLADSWTVDVDATPSGGITATVLNTDPRANATIRTKRGGETSLLRILEFGSRPHEIVPKKPGGMLVFFWPKVGRTVFARRVLHPGTRPYAMVELASLHAQALLKKSLDELANLLRRGLVES